MKMSQTMIAMGIAGSALFGLGGCWLEASFPIPLVPPQVPAVCADIASVQPGAANPYPDQSPGAAYSEQGFQTAQALLSRLQTELNPKAPHTKKVAFLLSEPITGRYLEGRGAVAVAPPDALRMILLGPGGTTGVDLWLSDAQQDFRFSVPALNLTVRGKLNSAATRRFPVDFLKFWLLQPVVGEFLWYERRGTADRFALRDAVQKDTVMEICAIFGTGADFRDTEVVIRRSRWSSPTPEGRSRCLDREVISARGLLCADTYYTQQSTGLSVQIFCESIEENPPNPKAFSDPDAPVQPGGATR